MAKKSVSRRWYWLSHHLDRDGYGYAGLRILDALTASGADVEGVDLVVEGDDEQGLGAPGRRWQVDGDAVIMTVPAWWGDVDCRRFVGHTMFEATRLPEGWAAAMNRHADEIVVPCEWCESVFRANGVTRPIHVARWGIDPGDYWPLERYRRQAAPYRFLWSGTPDRRKGWDLVYRAFWAAFQGADDVHLTLHFRHRPRGVVGSRDRNVDVVVGLFGRAELRQMLQRADCYVFPSRGEGWGSPPREAAATGLPVIATDFGGLAVEIEQWALPLRVERLEVAEYGYWDAGTIGEWAEPDFDHLVELMRWCYEHQVEAAGGGARAATWLAENATWERTARAIRRVVEC